MDLDPNVAHSIAELSEAAENGKFRVLTWLNNAYRSGCLEGHEDNHPSFLPHFLPPGSDTMSRTRLQPDELLEYIETAYSECGVGGDSKPKKPAKAASKPAKAAEPEEKEDTKPAEAKSRALEKPDKKPVSAPAAKGTDNAPEGFAELLERVRRIDEHKVNLEDVIPALDESVSRHVGPLVEGQQTLMRGQHVLQKGQRNIGSAIGFLAEVLTADADAKAEVERLIATDLDDIEDPLA